MKILSRMEKSREIIEESFRRFERLALCWTGGKDSTVLLWLVRRFCEEERRKLPPVLFIDEGDVFEEIWSFVSELSRKWGVPLHVLRNEDVLSRVSRVGEVVKVQALSEENRRELKALGYEEEEFVFEPESLVGNHLMKTVPLKRFVVEKGIEGLFTAIRWDEHPARQKEEYFSWREDPPHTRIHPLLHWTERDIWEAIHGFHIPFCELYRRGYRSLGARYNTFPTADIPAWEQDLARIPERAGRGQNKEKIMEKLRALGYM